MDILAKRMLVFILILFVAGCTDERYVEYTVTSNGIPGGSYKSVNGELVYSGPLINVAYVNESGDNVFMEVHPSMTDGYSGDFKAGDWVRIQAQCSETQGTITLQIKVDGDLAAEESIDLSQRNIVEASTTVN